jgi:2-oxo-4-hydroxy-4-carboxy-5-ureidoimidazoline decarboxylase
MNTILLERLNAASKAEFVAALGNIFEHTPLVAEVAADRRPFATLDALLQAMTDAVRSLAAEQRLTLIKAHPDLAGKAARAGALTAESTAEQTSAGLDRLSEDEYAHFHRLNDAYKSRFGIPFIVCVRRHTKGSILREFARRLKHEREAELETALEEILRIGALRIDQLVSAPEKLKLSGRISTHVLDTHLGKPAVGVKVALFELSADGTARLLATATTNSDGRTDHPLIGGRPVPIGDYELRFTIGPYFAATGLTLPEPPFLNVVPIRFSVAEAEGHYHVPLLATPWSYVTYRGS